MTPRPAVVAAWAAAALLAGGCAADATVTWRADADFEPLPPDTPVELYVRESSPPPLREALVARGAEVVSAFPEGERVAELAAHDSVWISWDSILDVVESRSRELGADIVLGTGAVHGATADGVLWFQLLRSERRHVE